MSDNPKPIIPLDQAKAKVKESVEDLHRNPNSDSSQTKVDKLLSVQTAILEYIRSKVSTSAMESQAQIQKIKVNSQTEIQKIKANSNAKNAINITLTQQINDLQNKLVEQEKKFGSSLQLLYDVNKEIGKAVEEKTNNAGVLPSSHINGLD